MKSSSSFFFFLLFLPQVSKNYYNLSYTKFIFVYLESRVVLKYMQGALGVQMTCTVRQ